MRELEGVGVRLCELLIEGTHDVFSQYGVPTEFVIGLIVVLERSLTIPRFQVFVLVPLH